MWYKVLQEGYEETIWELEENLENAKDKIKAYQRKLGQVVKKKNELAKGDLRAIEDSTARLPGAVSFSY